MRRITLSIALGLVFAFSSISAQSPIPIIVPAVTQANAGEPVADPAAALEEANSLAAVLKMLQDLKAANEEALKKQEATLAKLDELEKAAEQIKTFTKRG